MAGDGRRRPGKPAAYYSGRIFSLLKRLAKYCSVGGGLLGLLRVVDKVQCSIFSPVSKSGIRSILMTTGIVVDFF